ncbi:kell blood group glycoprotein isoform X4 [Hemicordylus capensis]|uniref:kell blood group glycoprotein isoform X4 n=1 Tax=Hemicordylus capensis TaxID=884348 RepID=UPI002303CA55|nr:kell blood group glycoprotein isoform X4 [Hemicordylus capensis]XP_053157206.1 kell blood group glycoprotein isoform X4 [Hemicordylus capensis]XP_053157208.1 kell blood group glycoprotein isoform X4 [Hemicordylus capensis]XP_053157209.1 kell blood group glycoprotein isoform X4 [Hemicordylus capensis]
MFCNDRHSENMRTASQVTCEDSGGVVKRRCRRGKVLLLCAVLLSALLGLVLLVVFTIVTCDLETCNTAECLVLLERLMLAQNDTIDPCEDFFSYTCGNWKANHTQGMNMVLLNVFDVLLEENQLIMKRLLEEPQFRIANSSKEKAVRFYNSCMDTARIEAQGAQPLKKLINEVGGWNITGSWKGTDFNQTLRILMGRYNTYPFFKAYVGPSPSDPNTNIIQIDHPEFELPSDTDSKKIENYPQVLRTYYLYLIKLGDLMGGHKSVTSTYIALALSFISNLQKAVTPLKKRQEKKMLFYPTNISELQVKAPAIDWLSCLQAAFHPVQLNVSQPIAVHDMDYLEGMSQLIGEWQNKRDVLQIYMILCLVENLSPALSRQFQEARQELTNTLYGRITESEVVRTERWRKCLSETSTFFGPILGEMIVQEIFPPKAKDLVGSTRFLIVFAAIDEEAEQMFSEIRDAVHSHLDHVEWMSKHSRQEAKEKIYSLQVEIGYPESMLQTNEVDHDYQELEIYEDNFFQNVIACLKSLQSRLLLRLVNPHLQDNWEVVPWSVHSYYSLRRHAVVFPAGMFRRPFFHTEFPSAVNFGAMGFFMAHELLHAFQDYVVLPESCPACDMKALAQSTDCLVKQYEMYSLKGHHINGSFTFLENAADTGGLTIAYQAYKNWLAKHRCVKELSWPGLSHHQLFFVGFVHAMCGHQSLEGLQTFLHRVLHSPPPLRVLGSLSNSQDFSRSFNCPRQSPMNPALKCRIW